MHADLVVSYMADREELREKVADAGLLVAAARRERHRMRTSTAFGKGGGMLAVIHDYWHFGEGMSNSNTGW